MWPQTDYPLTISTLLHEKFSNFGTEKYFSLTLLHFIANCDIVIAYCDGFSSE